MKFVISFVCAVVLGTALGAAQDAPTLSPLETAQLKIARLTDELRQAKLEAAACGGQLRALFEEGYGADSKQRFSAWLSAFERAHDGWTYDLQRDAVVQKERR